MSVCVCVWRGGRPGLGRNDMNIQKLIKGLALDGYQIILIKGELDCRATKYPFTENQLDVLKKYKREIVKHLTTSGNEFKNELDLSGLSKKWRGYLLERVEILVEHEGYTFLLT